jgi:methyl-accepting chemotaxis protein
MKNRVKPGALIGVFTIISIGLFIGVTIALTQDEIRVLVDERAQSAARENSEKISKWFGDYMAAARTLGQVMEGYKSIPPADRREYFNMAIRQALAANHELLSLYANWAPDALDGMDADYANTPGADETGRFIPAWANVYGELKVNPIVGFSWDGIAAQSPKFNGEYVLDPDVYLGQDGAALIANMGAPIKDGDTGDVVGLSGSVLILSTIQSMIERIKPFEDGQAMLFSAGGVVAAHSDPERLGKNMRESERDTFGPFLETMVDAVTTGTPASFSYRSPQSNTVMQYYSAPVAIGRAPQVWTLVIGVSRNTIMAPVHRLFGVCIIIGAFAMLLTLMLWTSSRALPKQEITVSSIDEDLSH